MQARDAIGRTWQMSTIQYDFNQPEGFELEYQAADGTRQQPVMIHSAKFGSIERFLGVLVEHYAGAFPPWLAPVQVVGIPIADGTTDYLRDVARRLGQTGIRVEVDDSDDRMQKKIRNAQLQKVPFMLIAGDEDVEEGAVSFRYRSGEQDNGVAVDDAVDTDREGGREPRVRYDGRIERPRRGAAGVRPVPAALDAAPDGLHQGPGERVGRGGRGRLPVLLDPVDARRGRSRRAPGRGDATSC